MFYIEFTYNMLYNTKCYITHVLYNTWQGVNQQRCDIQCDITPTNLPDDMSFFT